MTRILQNIFILIFPVVIFSCSPKTGQSVADASAEETVEASAEADPCGTFQDSRYGDDAITAHVLYRDYLKREQYDRAFPFWKKAFSIAPAADGKRTTHFSDGILFYEYFYEETEDEALKAKYIDTVFMLYDQMEECYGATGYVLGKKAFDLYFKFPDLQDEDTIFDYFKQSFDLDQDSAYYFILNPFTDLLVRRYFDDKISTEEAQEYAALIFDRLEKGLEDGENPEQWAIIADYVPSRLGAFEGEKGFYDCQYYLDKYVPLYEENPDDCEVITTIYHSLIWGDCGEESEEFVRIRDAYNESCRKIEEVATSSTARQAFDLLEKGDFEEAIEKFEQAAEETDNAERKAQIYLVIAKIYYGSLKRFPVAREYARKAAEARPNWGEPHLLIGKLYASSGPLCGPGTGWDSQIVVWPAIDEWEKARRMDPDAASEATALINRYSQYMPKREDIFLRSLNEGDPYTVPCWINQRTTIRITK